MGMYLNPGNEGFVGITRSDYVDKTGLIGVINRSIGTSSKLTCISRPRRFGKSYAAQMLCAYYDKSCDSRELFLPYQIAQDDTFETHLNQYNVIYLDMTNLLEKVLPENLTLFIKEKMTEEIRKEYPEVDANDTFDETLLNVVEYSGRKFIMIIDEWDSPIRENPEIEKTYLTFLRMLFKSSNITPKIFAAAYMTGILPIKKNGSQSAISDFREYTILNAGPFAEYTGFTEPEVRRLCEEKGLDFSMAKAWYDGYTVGDQHSVYNPYSMMMAVSSRRFTSYWKKTSAAEALMTYIDMDEEGLQEDVARLIAGEMIEVDPDGFQNDFVTFSNKDDVLTLMIHLGYLSYEEETDSYGGISGGRSFGYVRIPNEEIRIEFDQILRRAKHKDLIRLVQLSDRLLQDTLAGEEEKVARAFTAVRDSAYAPTFYNDEQGLRYVIRFAYLSCVDQYARIEEMPTGHGIADVVFVPKRRSALPAMIVELKWNKTADEAIEQIIDRNYPAVLKGYGGEIVVVGINYDTETKQHTCRIDRVDYRS